jgi:hypothetical protein
MFGESFEFPWEAGQWLEAVTESLRDQQTTVVAVAAGHCCNRAMVPAETITCNQAGGAKDAGHPT